MASNPWGSLTQLDYSPKFLITKSNQQGEDECNVKLHLT